MECSPERATVVYRSKDGKEKKTYDNLEWLAAMDCNGFYSQLPALEEEDTSQLPPPHWECRIAPAGTIGLPLVAPVCLDSGGSTPFSSPFVTALCRGTRLGLAFVSLAPGMHNISHVLFNDTPLRPSESVSVRNKLLVFDVGKPGREP